MIFKNGEEKITFRNGMFWLLLVEINRKYDKVFLFPSKEQKDREINEYEYNRAKRYLLNKINCD